MRTATPSNAYELIVDWLLAWFVTLQDMADRRCCVPLFHNVGAMGQLQDLSVPGKLTYQSKQPPDVEDQAGSGLDGFQAAM